MEWISVNDRLPDNDTICIVWCEKGIFEYFELVRFNSIYHNEDRNKFFKYGDVFDKDVTEYVTHWMIPTKPKKHLK